MSCPDTPAPEEPTDGSSNRPSHSGPRPESQDVGNLMQGRVAEHPGLFHRQQIRGVEEHVAEVGKIVLLAHATGPRYRQYRPGAVDRLHPNIDEQVVDMDAEQGGITGLALPLVGRQHVPGRQAAE